MLNRTSKELQQLWAVRAQQCQQRTASNFWAVRAKQYNTFISNCAYPTPLAGWHRVTEQGLPIGFQARPSARKKRNKFPSIEQLEPLLWPPVARSECEPVAARNPGLPWAPFGTRRSLPRAIRDGDNHSQEKLRQRMDTTTHQGPPNNQRNEGLAQDTA